jgi:hypothetical protein
VIKPAEDRPLRLAVGICASIQKLIAYRLLKPALELPRTVKLRCQTGDLSQLLNICTSALLTPCSATARLRIKTRPRSAATH